MSDGKKRKKEEDMTKDFIRLVPRTKDKRKNAQK